MAKKLGFKDYITVDYAPGMPDLIKKNAKKRKGDTGAGSNAEYSSTHPPRQEQMHDPIALGKHAPNIGMGWTGKHRTVKDPGSKTGRHVHVFQYTEEVQEVSQALGHKVAKARQAQASALRQKAVDEPDMMKAFAHTKAANKAERKAGQSYNRLMKKEEVELGELSKKTLGSYIKKASTNQIGNTAAVLSGKKDAETDRARKRIGQRMAGIAKATDRLTKEEVELDEVKTYFAIATKSAGAKSGWKRVPDTRFDTEQSAINYGNKYHTDKSGAKMYKVVTFKEEVELDEYNTKSSKAIVRKDNKPIAIYPDLKSAQRDYHGKDGHDIGMRSHSAAMRIKKENPGIKIVEGVEEVDEALNMQQRRKRALIMRRLKSRIKLGRERAKRRIASPEKLQRRARRQARMMIFKRLTKDIPKSELTYQRRQEIEKRLDKPAVKKRIERIAKRLLPKVRKAEMERKRGPSSND